MEEASAEGLVSASLAVQPPVCFSQTVVRWVRGEREPVAYLRTTFCTPLLEMQDVERYKDPANWPSCSPLWCAMAEDHKENGKQCYREVVSLDCGNPLVKQIEVCLCFEIVEDTADRFHMKYDMCAAQTSQDVVFDEGGILITTRDDQLCFTSSKAVRFREPLDAPSFAVVACPLGYGYAAEDFVFSCAVPEQLADNRRPDARQPG
jgi:hypothetical protein